ncbi:hypothetical protein Q7A53_05240 [Halobacillus rhizosphaerae]|uniref:hypothetical protein n=1 Tax=Halobacillus rhizosphaerae TaxID=3064889 RepID=UPI00398BA6CF
MNKEELDKLWKQVSHVGEVLNLEYDSMLELGSIFGQMRTEIIRLQGESKMLELHLEHERKMFDLLEKSVDESQYPQFILKRFHELRRKEDV